jgi:hypothetical protein
MSITITGGISFGGGVGITAAPPATPTAAWFAGGGGAGGQASIVQRITYATDTATATVRGPLDGVRYAQGATSDLNYGWYAGGKIGSPLSMVSRITYATDTNTASNRGPLSYRAYYIAATGNTTYGWFGGGLDFDGFSNVKVSTVSRITYATDTDTGTSRGRLSSIFFGMAAAGNTTDGWFGGGESSSGTSSTVNRITYATDTATASVKGPLSLARQRLAATGTPSYGWFGAGYNPGTPFFSSVDRIDYANDTTTASTRGPLSSARIGLAASTDSDTYGWFGGGYNSPSPGQKTTVDRITYATDTATATERGPLSSARTYLAASSGLQ